MPSDNATLDKLACVIETLREHINRDHATWQNETRTRTVLINPLLGALGWSEPSVITSEYSIGYGRGFADYALHPTGQKGRPIAFIEAKRLREPLNDEHLNQALKYASKRNSVRYVGLTNGDRCAGVDRPTSGLGNPARPLLSADADQPRGLRHAGVEAAVVEAQPKRRLELGVDRDDARALALPSPDPQRRAVGVQLEVAGLQRQGLGDAKAGAPLDQHHESRGGVRGLADQVLDLGRFEIFRQATFPPGLLTHRAVFGVQPAARGPTCGPGRRGRQRYTFHDSVASVPIALFLTDSPAPQTGAGLGVVFCCQPAVHQAPQTSEDGADAFEKAPEHEPQDAAHHE